MASLMSFLTRRQADRTILMFGICVFMFKLFRHNVLATSPDRSKPKSCLILFKHIAGNEHEFWDCYRNGLLHQATFPQAKLDKRKGIWATLADAGISAYDPRPVYFLPETTQFFLN